MDPTKEKDIEDEYLSSLMDLNVNSKPLINMLTMLADDNIEFAHVIVKAVEKHLAKVQPEVKLPILYLIDSIVKNVGKEYKPLFAQNIVNMFCGVFEKVNEKVREKMFNLRMTWNEVFPQTKLYALDVKTNVMDSNWPITAKIVPKSVHVNPNFFKGAPEKPTQSRATEELRLKMESKERELLELKQRKIELELMVTKKKIAESEKEIRVGLNHPHSQGVPLASAVMPPNQIIHGPPHQQGRTRIAPVNSAMLASARSRDPRLSKMGPNNQSTSQSSHSQHQRVPPPMNSVVLSSTITKSLPRIPKFSQSNSSLANKSSRDNDRNRDPRSRRNKEKEESSKSNKSPSSKDKSKSSPSSSKFMSSRSSDRKKSGSSDDSSPRKKIEDEKKSSKSPSSHHRVSHFQSKSPAKNNELESKDVDLRVVPGMEAMKPDSTTNITKTNKDKLLNDLLNGEDLKSTSHETITSDNEEAPMEQSPMQDVDLRFTEGGKKRSLSNEPSESEPTNKKNRSEDLLFGMKDVDLRNLGEASQGTEKRFKTKEKADFEAVRAKLNATKEKSKIRGGIKLLDEFPSMPPGENGNTELVKKILSRKDRQHIKDVKERESSPNVDSNDETPEPVPVSKQSRFNPVQERSERMDDVADMGNLTAAELRKSAQVPASIRKEKRKGSKWNQPAAQQWPVAPNTRPNMMPPVNIPPSQHMMPQHFVNPWESNPMIQEMQAQTQMPLVVPQSTSHPVLNNKMRTLRLDGTKDHLLRFYHETAIIFNDLGEPHDIKFSSGQSRVVIDDQYSADLNFNDSYKSIFIESNVHQIKFGSPTRELYVDNNFYECYFNNQPTQIVLNDRLRMVRIEGNAPEVKIGKKRNDLVLGLINIVIDAEIMVPVFLDTTIQYFEFKGKIFTLQFADFFMSVIINNDPFKVEFGGHPKNYVLNGQKHFIRFTELPGNVTPGRVNMRGMRRTHLFKSCKSPPLLEPLEPINDSLDIGQLVENDMRDQTPQNEAPIIMTNTLPPNIIPGIGQEAQGAPAIGVPNLDINDLLKKLVATGIIGGATPAPAPAPETSTKASTNNGKKAKSPEPRQESRKSRFQHQSQHHNQQQQKQPEEKQNIVSVILTRPDTIKKRQSAIVDTLYLGIQCSSCGLRFPPEQTMKYSQHLDWHFRQNRRERDSKRRAHFRKWYYNQSDWIKYEEIEDLEEREKNFFETQQESMMDQGDDSNAARGAGSNLENVPAVSCPAGPEDANRCCEMCHDEFDQFFNEETEEWHLRSALKIDDKFYHPICYDDYKASLTLDESTLAEASTDATKEEDVEMEDADDVVIKVEKEVIGEKEPTKGATEDDDDVIMLPQEEPVVTEILDETEIAGEGSKMLETSSIDDDVMIQEPKIETQLVLDDDDDENHQTAPSTSDDSSPNLIVKIKEEPQDDGYEDLVNEEDAFVEVTAIDNNDLMQDDAYVNSPKAPFQPAQDENAVFDESSMTMMPSPGPNDDLSRDNLDDDNNSRPESSGPALIGGNRKLKIVLSSLAQTNLSNKNLNTISNVNEQNENSNLDSVNKLDSNSVELQSEAQPTDAIDDQEQPEIEFQFKPQLQGVKLERNFVPVKRGFENSGLCSIM